MPVGEMLNRMSSAEITEWAAYFQLEAENKGGKKTQKQPSQTPAEIRALFGHRVVKKPKEQS